MPGSEAATVDGTSDVIDSVASTTLPTISDPELRNKWNKLVLDIRSTRLETDIEERHSRGNLERALELALSHPEEMSISTEPMGRRHDMESHIRGHFENLFNNDDWGTEFKSPRPDVEYLLKACELAYLYDSAYRFSDEIVVRPELNGLEEVAFVELPTSLHEWMGEVDLVWLTLADELAAEEPLEDWIDRLYDERESFVTEAKNRETFLPISGDYTEDPEGIKTKITKRLSRNANVSPRLVHNYCFTRTVDQF